MPTFSLNYILSAHKTVQVNTKKSYPHRGPLFTKPFPKTLITLCQISSITELQFYIGRCKINIEQAFCFERGFLVAHIPIETVPYLEAAIYLPMLIIVLEKDYAQIETGQFKLKRPYLHLIEKARKNAEEDLRKTKAYLKNHHLKVVRGGSDELFTEYFFHYHQIIEVRRYSNIRLRNRVEELLKFYLNEASKDSQKGNS